MKRIGGFLMNSRVHAMPGIRLINSLSKDIELPRGGDALEIGCGAGFSSAHLARECGIKVVGTDAEARKVETAKRKNGGADNVSFIVADATSLPFEDASFDLVLSQNVFHHFPDWRTAAEECARVIRPGGLFLFSDISGPGTFMRLLSRVEKDHGFSESEELTKLLGTRGLKVAKRVEPEGRLHKQFTILFRKE